MNANIQALNGGKAHKPIYKVRISEPVGLKFPVGTVGVKKDKWVEAAKGTNLFFGIYVDNEGNRSFSTIPFAEVVERMKQQLSPVPLKNDKGNRLLFYLSPNDLVYVPTEDEIENQSPVTFQNMTCKSERIYKLVSCTTNYAFFVPANIATPIVATTELGANNKAEKAWDGVMIKQHCIKLTIDRLGNFSLGNDYHNSHDKENALLRKSGLFVSQE
ncbi:MAG: hypothetical protein ACRCX1_03970 [Bacteroidales bacterium]